MVILRSLLFSFIVIFFSTALAQYQLPHVVDNLIQRPPFEDPRPVEYSSPISTPSFGLENYIPDFNVNEQVGNSQKSVPKVAVNSNGIAFVVWGDYRNGNAMVFGQIIDSSGNIVGSEFQINSDDRNRFYNYPDVAANDNGDFLVVWQDGRSWTNIYSRLYQEDGTPISSELNLMDDATYGQQYSPRIDFNDNQFVVVWYDTRNGYIYDIYGQRLDASGAKIDTNFAVNDDIQGSRKYLPSVAVDSDGEFLVSWYSSTPSYYNIFTREFNANATPKDTVFQITPDSLTVSNYYPEIALVDTGYMVVWYGYPNGYNRIFGNKFIKGHGPSTNNIEITDVSGTYSAYEPKIENFGNNELIVTWRDTRNGTYHFYGQKLFGDQKINSNFLLNDLSETGNKISGFMSCDNSGNFIQLWIDLKIPENNYIKSRRFYSDGTPKDISFRVDSDENSSNQYYPSIAVRQNGSFIATWEDFRNRSNDIYFQQINNNGTPVDSNKFTNSTSATYRPDIAIGKHDGFIITWYEYKSPEYEIFAQRFDENGINIGDPFVVSTNNVGTHSYIPSIASNQSGEFVITWYQYVNNYYRIFAQLYNDVGDTVGSNILVSSDTLNYYNNLPKVGMDSTGAFAVVWYSNSPSAGNNYDILMQRYDSNGLPVGENFIVNDDTSGFNQYSPDITVNANGNAVVAWQDYRSPANIYYQRFINIGSSVGFALIDSNRAISGETQYGTNIKVEMNEQEDFVIIFNKYNSSKNDLYLKAFNSDGSSHSDMFLVSANSNREQLYPDVSFVGDKIYSVWQDNHELGVGFDIYANVFDWSELVSGTEIQNPNVPTNFSLDQNYPNPFNPTTKIKFNLPKESKVNIDIFNALGQKVSTLVNSKRTAGEHSAEFNAAHLASGVYYYRIQAGNFNQVKKMVLLK